MFLALAACSQAPAAKQITPSATPVPFEEAIPATLDEIRNAARQERWIAVEAGLRRLSESPDPVTRARALAMLTLFYFDRDLHDEGAATLLLAVETDPGIAPHLSLRRVSTLEKSGRHAEAVAVADEIVAIAPGSAAARIAQIRKPALVALAGDLDSAATLLSQLAVPIDEFTEEEWVGLANRFDVAGAGQTADSIRLRILREYTRTRFAESLYGDLASAEESPSALDALGFAEGLDLADRLGRVNRYDQALDLIGRLERCFPDSAADPTLRYIRVKSFFNSRRYELVIAEPNPPGEPYEQSIRFLQARAHWRTDRSADFLRLAGEILDKSPSSKEASETKLLLAKYYVTDETDYPKATQYLAEAIAAGAGGDQGENLWTLGWTQTLAGDDAVALATFAKYVQTYPDADYTTNALFWSGKIYTRQGNIERRDEQFKRLIQLFPYSYYAYRAREIAGLPLTPPGIIESGYDFPQLDASASVEKETGLALVRSLLEIGLPREAAHEVKLLAAHHPDDAALAFRLADLYAAAGEHFAANVLLQRRFRNIVRHGGTGVPQRFWEILFPLPYRELIEPAAVRNSVDPFLVASIIRQESGFEPTVVSNAGAIGLMQLMPAEAVRIATLGGLPPSGREQLFDPATNLAMGAAEIRQKLDAMQNREMLAIAAYNAGEEAVQRWLARTPLDDVDLFIDSIPFAETKLYVKNVTRNQYEYRRIHGRNPAGETASR